MSIIFLYNEAEVSKLTCAKFYSNEIREKKNVKNIIFHVLLSNR